MVWFIVEKICCKLPCLQASTERWNRLNQENVQRIYNMHNWFVPIWKKNISHFITKKEGKFPPYSRLWFTITWPTNFFVIFLFVQERFWDIDFFSVAIACFYSINFNGKNGKTPPIFFILSALTWNKTTLTTFSKPFSSDHNYAILYDTMKKIKISLSSGKLIWYNFSYCEQLFLRSIDACERISCYHS